ncbi:MAG: peptidoglycan DD-metalloendopeptidase family protein [Gorillibacterium sp.]|nr:peptidoglycan DD-metalloendopeptidase family protein [Gorillibacterium sp.]
MAGFKSIDWFRKLLPVKAKAAENQCQGLSTTKKEKLNKKVTLPVSSPHTYSQKQHKKDSAQPKAEVVVPSAPANGKLSPAVNIRSKKQDTSQKPASSRPHAASSVPNKTAPQQSPLLSPMVQQGKKSSQAYRVNAKEVETPNVFIASEVTPAEVPLTPIPAQQLPELVSLQELSEQEPVETLPAAERVIMELASKRPLMKLPLLLSKGTDQVKLRRILQASAASGAILLAVVITFGGHKYVEANTLEVYHVFMNGAEVGVVSNPQVVDDFKINKYRKLAQIYPQTQMVLNTDGITLTSEKAFKAETDDEATLSTLSSMLTSHAVGTELFVNGTSVGILKSEEEANDILERMKEPYLSAKDKTGLQVSMLSTAAKKAIPAPGESNLEKVEFVEKVELRPVEVDPQGFANPETILTTLKTGNVRPRDYTVVQGDYLGAIANKFDVTIDAIKKKNPEIKNDFIREGQILNLTVLQPAITVRTVEMVTETAEIAYSTEVIRDANLKDGIVKKITPGKAGKKKVVFEVTKLNGEVDSEQMLEEEVLVQPVKEVIKRGTKVILGEGTGNFSWPVVSSTLTSGFGKRWGKLHKGIDLTSSNKNILAADNGVVIKSGYRYDYGNFIVIDHHNGYETLYGHLSKISVTNGQIVEKGEKIGYMGSTGDSTGVHLHFEIHRSGELQNPLTYLNR